VGSKGNPKGSIVFVAESPGKEEVKAGMPLVGQAGKIFHTFVPDVNSPEGAEIYILNAMECYPRPNPRIKNEKSMNYATTCCRERLLAKVAEHPRKLIIAMGNSAVRSITGDYGLKITQIRGEVIPSSLASLGVFPIVHIAAIAKGTGSFRQWQDDIRLALQLAQTDYHPQQAYIKPTYQVVTTKAATATIIKKLLKTPRGLISCDIETAGFNPRSDRILSVHITPHPGKHVYTFTPKCIPWLKALLESKKIKWNYHNGKFDIKFFRLQYGINAHVDDDTMLMSYTLDETGGVHDLESVSSDHLASPNWKAMLDQYLPKKFASYEIIPTDVLHEYGSYDAGNTERLRSVLWPKIVAQPNLKQLYEDILIPAVDYLAEVETNGFTVDLKRLGENGVYFQAEQERILSDIADMCGHSVNPNSPPQMQQLLFNELHLPNIAKGSTAKEILDKLFIRTEHPIIPKIKEYRKATKAYGTYVKGLLDDIDPSTGRIHTTYNIHGTVTGRLSSSNPNMQNIPRLAQLRGQFVASPGHYLLEIDLSQAELRLLAALSQDPDLVRVYLTDGDLHNDLAIYLFGTRFTKEQRVKCKNVNFGIIYGITEYGLAEQMKVSVHEAREYLQGWYSKYRVAAEFIQTMRDAPRLGQTITTCFGRMKRHGLVTQENLRYLQNEAANFPEQSMASDITLRAGMEIFKTLIRWRVKIVNTIHDSIVMEVPQHKGPEGRRHILYKAAALTKKTMERIPLDYGINVIPFKADVEAGGVDLKHKDKDTGKMQRVEARWAYLKPLAIPQEYLQ